LPFIFVVVMSLAAAGDIRAQDAFLGRSADQWSERLTSSQGQQRVHAAWAIAQLAGQAAGGPGDQVHFAELVKLVSDNDAMVRYWGVIGLAAFAERLGQGDGGQTAVVNTLEPLLDDNAAAPRIAAATSLGLFGQPGKALPILVSALSDPHESIRIQAAAALEKLGPAARPAEAALRHATNDHSQYVKRIAARALVPFDAGPK
jgi:HEAT repeat protein